MVSAQKAYPVKEFKILENASEPDVALVSVRTSHDDLYFVVNREILDAMAKAFREQAGKMTPKVGPVV